MTRKSSLSVEVPLPDELSTGSQSGPDRIRRLKRQKVERIRHEPTEALGEGAVGLRVIRTIGRRSRRWHDTPIGVLRLRGRSYAVCPDARRDWARNLADDSHCTLAAGGQEWPAGAVPASETAAVQAVRGYLAAEVPWEVDVFPMRPTAPDDVIRAHLPQMAVFELRSDDGSWLR